jgi:putative ABC transport system permease protein
VLGVAVAVTAFCVIRSAIGAWYLQSEAAAPDRLITRHAVSIVFELPLAYIDKIAKVPGVTGVSHASWFGGIYVDQANFFAKFAVDHTTYFAMYPELVIPPDEWETFSKERNAVLVGRQLADRFGWKVGDAIRIIGDIYPGDWDFVIRGIYTGANEDTDESTWYFRFDYLDERMRQETPGRAGQIGTAVIQIEDPNQAARISEAIDKLFENSLAETKTETEKAFILGFISMSNEIILGLQIVSIMVIGIILLVMANTLAMAARERVNEYALLKTLGFRPFHLIGLVYGESLAIATAGGALGLGLSFLAVPILQAAVQTFLPKLPLSPITLVLGMISALAVGLLAALFPTIRAVRTPIVEGLRPID